MKILMMLLVVCTLCISCYGIDLEQPEYEADWMNLYHNNVMGYFDDFSPSPIIEYVDGQPSRYINDLGLEFIVGGWTAGTHWIPGAYGSKNGFSNYYGNTYWNHPQYYSNYIPTHSVPEPMTVGLLALGSMFVVGSGMRNKRSV